MFSNHSLGTSCAGFLRSAALLFVLCLLIPACGMVSVSFGPQGKKGKGDDEKDKPVIIIPVETASPHRGDVSMYFETTTRVEAERRVDVAAKANARCIELLVDEGESVTAGQALAELEKEEAEASYLQSEVLTRQNETSYELAKQQYEQGLGPKMEMDNARYTYEQSMATLESQKIQLDYLTIRAPIDGIVTSRQIQPGMLVSSGTVVFGIMDPTSFMLAIAPPEKELPNLKIGQKAKVTIDSIRGQEFDASIRRINPSVDPVSGTVKVVLDFDGDIRARLHESAFARVKLVMATLSNVLLIPREAIVEENGQKFVYVARQSDGVPPIAKKAEAEPEKDRKSLLQGEAEASVTDDVDTGESEFPGADYVAERVDIRTGLEDSQHVQVFAQDLSVDDLLVTNGQHTLETGAYLRLTGPTDDVRANAHLSADDALDEAKARREAGESAPTGGSRRGK